MRAVQLYGAHDVRVVDVPMPAIREDGDAIIQLAAACVCGSDLWAYRGIDPISDPITVGHEYCGTVVEIGPSVTTVKVGDFVVGSFFASCGVCEICRSGYPSGCIHRVGMGGENCQAEYVRVPMADGTLVATPGQPEPDLIPHLLAASVSARRGRSDEARGRVRKARLSCDLPEADALQPSDADALVAALP